MPFSRDQLVALLGYLDEMVFGTGIACDHTLARTREWAEQEGMKVEDVVKGVSEFGGHRDCEVAFNVTPDKFGWNEE